MRLKPVYTRTGGRHDLHSDAQLQSAVFDSDACSTVAELGASVIAGAVA
jgi:hypothetical protein